MYRKRERETGRQKDIESEERQRKWREWEKAEWRVSIGKDKPENQYCIDWDLVLPRLILNINQKFYKDGQDTQESREAIN